MRLKALRDHVLVIPQDRLPEKILEAGLYIPKPEMQGVPYIGEVYSIGENVNTGDLRLICGHKVVFDEKTPKGFKFNGKILFKLHKSQICGILS